MLNELAEGDTIVITKISRIASTLTDLKSITESIKIKGLRLIILELSNTIDIDNIKNISPDMWISFMSEFEKDISYEKRCLGHLKSQNINTQSLTSGRQCKYTVKQLIDALRIHERYSYQEISNITGISKRTLLRAKKSLQIE